MEDGDLGDDVWDKLSGDGGGDDDAAGDDAGDGEPMVEVGPPVRVTFVITADKVPVAPWAQGWRVGALGPQDGQVMLVCEHDIELSPVAQLSAVTGLLGTVKQAQLEVVWWAIQTRGPVGGGPSAGPEGLDQEFADLLRGEAPEAPPDPAEP